MAQGQDTGKAPENQGSDGAGAAAPSYDDTFKALSAELAGKPAAEPAGGDQGQTGGEGAGEDGTAVSGDAGAAGEGLPDPSAVGADGKAKGGEGDQGGQQAGGEQQAKEPDGTQKAGEMSSTDFLQQFREIVNAGTAGKQEDKPAGGDQQPQPFQPAAYTQDEQDLITAAWKDFPDVMKAAELERSRELQAVTHHVFKEVTNYYKPFMDRLAAVEGTTGRVATDAHTAALHQAVPDYNAVAPKVVEWVKSAPAILKPAYEAVIKTGSIDDVVSLIGMWRKETGTESPKPGGGQQAQGGGQQSGDQQRQQAQGGGQQQGQRKGPDPKVIAGLVPVAGKRTGTGDGGVDANDFDGAFAVAAADAVRGAQQVGR